VNLTRAVVRPPSPNFADGLTSAVLGKPSYALALAQHARYCEELQRCGLELTRLRATDTFPDATFVEDTAILTARGSVLCRPGAETRRGEVASVADALVSLTPALGTIVAPGTVDGGDVCDAGDRFLIGLSTRTNEEGARQLHALLSKNGYDAAVLDLRDRPELLHLKSGLAALHDGRLVAVEALAGKPELRGRTIVRVTPDEAYAANCIGVNGRVLIASGFPRLEEALVRLRYDVVTLDMSEFRKMDGGLSCLSLRS
jgi:dimethylargininase